MAASLLDKLSPGQQKRLEQFERMLREFNRSVNLVSRADEERLFERHVLHALALALKTFPDGTTVVDWGTGGGLPAIPLAIAFPRVQVIAVDSVEKKIRAVRTMARRLELVNVEAWSGRAETFDKSASYSVSRASTTLAELWAWHTRIGEAPSELPAEGCWRPGLICLKGGDLSEERRTLPAEVRVLQHRLENMLAGSYFEEKYVVECFVETEPPPDEHRS